LNAKFTIIFVLALNWQVFEWQMFQPISDISKLSNVHLRITIVDAGSQKPSQRSFFIFPIAHLYLANVTRATMTAIFSEHP
jgi:hypothetical protein